MSTLKPAPVSSRQLQWDGNTASAEISSTNGLGLVYGDSVDLGLTVVSTRTGREVVYVVADEKVDSEGDTLYWTLRSACGQYTLTLWNDLMNKLRRKQIAEAQAQIATALELLAAAKDDLEAMAADERDSFDNLPEGLQASDQGQMSEASADALDEAVSALDSAIGELDQIEGQLETASE